MIAASYIEYFSMCLHHRVAPNIEHLRIVPSHQAWNTYYVSVCFDEEENERRWRRSESSFFHHFLHIRHIAWQIKVNGSPVHQWHWNISTLFQVLFFRSILYQGRRFSIAVWLIIILCCKINVYNIGMSSFIGRTGSSSSAFCM